MKAPPAGYVYVGRAASMAHLDSSRVQYWCRRMAAVSRPAFRCHKVLVNRHWRWVIERESFLKWVRGRR